jgi:hypothetical protein
MRCCVSLWKDASFYTGIAVLQGRSPVKIKQMTLRKATRIRNKSRFCNSAVQILPCFRDQPIGEKTGNAPISVWRKMTHTSFAEYGMTLNELKAPPVVSDTHWGYILRPSEEMMARAALLEIAATFSGVLILMLAYAQWMLPGSSDAPDLLAMKLAISVILSIFSVVLILAGQRGLVMELQMDRTKQELRLVQRSRRGYGRMIRRMSFADVSSVFLERSKSQRSARLCLRLARTNEVVAILTSDQSHLLELRNDLGEFINAPRVIPRNVARIAVAAN